MLLLKSDKLETKKGDEKPNGVEETKGSNAEVLENAESDIGGAGAAQNVAKTRDIDAW